MPRIPGVNHQNAVRALEKAGFQIIRQGKHIVMSDGTRQVRIWFRITSRSGGTFLTCQRTEKTG